MENFEFSQVCLCCGSVLHAFTWRVNEKSSLLSKYSLLFFYKVGKKFTCFVQYLADLFFFRQNSVGNLCFVYFSFCSYLLLLAYKREAFLEKRLKCSSPRDFENCEQFGENIVALCA